MRPVWATVIVLVGVTISIVMLAAINVIGLEFYRCAAPRMMRVAGGATLVAACVAVIVLIRRRFVQGYPTAVSLALLAAIVMVLVLPWLSVAAVYRARVGAWSLYESTVLRGVVQDKRNAAIDSSDQVTLLSELIRFKDPTKMFTDYCSCQSSDEVRFGDVTLEQYFEGAVTREELNRAASAEWERTPGWERVGHYVVMCDHEVLKRVFDHEVLVGYTLPRKAVEFSPMLIVRGDNSIEQVSSAEDVAWLEAAVKKATAKGLPVPPDDVAGHARRLLGL